MLFAASGRETPSFGAVTAVGVAAGAIAEAAPTGDSAPAEIGADVERVAVETATAVGREDAAIAAAIVFVVVVVVDAVADAVVVDGIADVVVVVVVVVVVAAVADVVVVVADTSAAVEDSEGC